MLENTQLDHPLIGTAVWCALALITFAVFVTAQFCGATQDKKTVLVLHSYHKGLSWTDSITEGISRRFAENGVDVDVFYEFMDTKRYTGKDLYSNLEHLYSYKYGDVAFDAIISSDDNAYRFLLDRGQRLFPRTPVVFCGVNSFTPRDIQDRPEFTGVEEHFDFKATIEAGLALQPGVDTVVVLSDQTTSGVANRHRLDAIIPGIDRDVNFQFFDNHSMDEVRQYVSALDDNAMVFWLHFTKDRTGQYFSFAESAELVSEASSVPLYSSWDFHMNHGIVGGMITSGVQQGATAAGLALRILEGARPHILPVISKSPNRYMFDYTQMRRHGLGVADIPPESLVINRPPGFWQKQGKVIGLFAGGFILLATIILLLSISNIKRKRAEMTATAAKNKYLGIFNDTSIAILVEDFSELVDDLQEILRQAGDDVRRYLEDRPELLGVLGRKIRVRDANPAALRLYGISETMQLDGLLQRLAVGQGRKEVLDFYVALLEGGDSFVTETVNRTLSGNKLNIILEVKLPGDFEEYDSVLVSVVDITERKQAEKALQVSETRFRTAFNSAATGMALLGIDGKYLKVNRMLCAILDYREEELIGENWRSVTHPEDQQKSTDFLERILAGEECEPFEKRYLNRQGKTVWVLFNGSLLFDSAARPVNIIAQFQDITKRKELESQLLQAQKLESVGTMAGGIAHDFNNLLMGVMGNISLLLLDKEDTHPDYQRLKNIEEYAQSGSNLTRQLLGFAKGGKYEVTTCDIHDILRSNCRLFQQTHKEIEMVLEFDAAVASIEADRSQIDQVFYNFYVNAWQAMEGGGKITIRSQNVALDREFTDSHEAAPGHYIAVEVEDNGVGMDDATLSRIFDPFFTTKEISRGTGLGLASCYGIISNHAGIILAESEIDRGSCFTVYLPVSESGAECHEISDENREVVPGKGRILLIDDEPMILDVGCKMLEVLGYEVTRAEGGSAALDILRQQQQGFDLVIVDMIMPGMGGGEIFDAIRERDGTIDVLLSSGYSLDDGARSVLERGGRGFIQKPFDLETLSKKIHHVLESAGGKE